MTESEEILLQESINRKEQDDHIQEMNSELLVRLIPITKKEIVEIRKELHLSFVKAALVHFSKNTIFSIRDISNKIENIARCKMEDPLIISILDILHEEKIVEHIEGNKYQIVSEIDLPDFNDITNTTWEEFLTFLKKEKIEYDSFLDKELRNLFDSVVLKFLTKFIISSDPLEKKIDNLPLDDFKSLINLTLSD